MNSSTRLRIKWEIAIGCLSIGALAVCAGWLNGSFGNIRPYPKEYRIQEENRLQEAGIVRGGFNYPYNGCKWEPKSVESLRNRIGWEKGTISLQLFADLGDGTSKPGCVPLLFINDTDHDLQVPTEGGDIGLKLEVSLSEGKWQRAQYHRYSFCGVSYGKRKLPAHNCAKIQGYEPSSGRMAKVRFAVHNGASDKIVSAEFAGVYSPEDVAMSAFDEMAFREADLALLRSFLLRKISPALLPQNESISHLRGCAWEGIVRGPHDKIAALALAKEVINYDPTLETTPVSGIERMMDDWRTAMAEEEKTHRSIYGFIVQN